MELDLGYRAPWATRIARALDSTPVRATTVALVLISVVPEIHVGQARWLLFAGFFLLIAALRLIILPQRRAASSLDVALLVADVLVAITFLPWEHWTSWMTTDRLHAAWVARLLVLARPSWAVLEDLWGILTRRERIQQFASVTSAVVILALISTSLLLNLAPPFDYNGALGPDDDTFLDVLWWAFRQLESADNLVPTLRNHPTVVAVSLGLTLVGVFIIAFIIGIGSSVVEQLVRAQRRRPVDYDGHSVVVGPVHDAEVVVRQLVRLHEKNRSLQRINPRDVALWLAGRGPRPRRHALPRIALLGGEEEPPPFLFEPNMRKVLYRTGHPSSAQGLALVGAHRARRMLLLAHPEAPHTADAIALGALTSLRGLSAKTFAYIELFDPTNHSLAEVIGGPRTVSLEVPRIVGQFLSAHLVIPGVDGVFKDLLTADGSEIYTHIFIEPWELSALHSWRAAQPLLSWEALCARAQSFGVTLLGVMIGSEDRGPRSHGDGVPFDGLHPWLNPNAAPSEPALQGLGLQAGAIRLSLLAGLIGLSPTYKEMKLLSLSLLRDPPSGGPAPPAPEHAITVVDHLHVDDGDLRKVPIIGDSPALTALVMELSALVPGIELALLIPNDGIRAPLEDRLADLPLDWAGADRTAGLGELVQLGGTRTRLRLKEAAGRQLIAEASALIETWGGCEAAVFLADASSVDPDAITVHRVLRFCQAQAARIATGAPLHLLVELHSEERGERLAHDVSKLLRSPPNLRLTPVSADRIRNYFMVNSAFVPGVDRIYHELLSERGQDLLRLSYTGGGGSARFGDLTAALFSKGLLPIGFEHRGEHPHLNPGLSTGVDLSRLEAIYALGDVQRDRLGADRGIDHD